MGGGHRTARLLDLHAGDTNIAIRYARTLPAPTWQRWLSAARGKWQSGDIDHLSFREELHAIEAVIAGQGIGIFSDVLVARELAGKTL